MATKPTDRILDWASGGSATDPGGAKEANGWIVDERPPAFWWNWILNSFGQWLSWSETSIDDIETKTDYITVTQSVNLDAMESGIASNSALLSQVLGKGVTSSGTFLAATGEYGIDEASSTVSSTKVDVYFDTAFANTQYIPIVCGANENNDYFHAVGATHASYCSVKTYDLSTGALVDPSAIDVQFFLDVKGVI